VGNFDIIRPKIVLRSRVDSGDEKKATKDAREGSLSFFRQSMRLRKMTFFVLSVGLLLVAAPGHAQSPAPSEYQLKAAFLYNFAKFTDWPPEAFADAKSPFTIGILGDNPFGSDLEQTVAGKKISEHPITIQTFRSATDATNCHILFISPSQKERFPAIIQSLRGTTVLTVSETERFIEAGGMVNFVEEASKIRFQINDEAAKVARLKISSRLLGLAVRSPR
jgi:hypothetical protein